MNSLMADFTATPIRPTIVCDPILALASSMVRVPEPKRPVRCALPGCRSETIHNGGYCCAAHCQEHRELRRILFRKEQ